MNNFRNIFKTLMFFVLVLFALSCEDMTGPYQFSSYTSNLSSTEYASAIVYYPTNITELPCPGIVVSGGFTNTKEQMSWVSEALASYGFIVLAFTPTNTLGTPPVWRDGHNGGIEKLIAENSRLGSPIYGKLDIQKLGVWGYSFGGAGAVLAANSNSKIKSVVAVCPTYQSGSAINVPALFIGGTADVVAPASGVEAIYNTVLGPEKKLFINISGMDHLDPPNTGSQSMHAVMGKYFVAWEQMVLKNNSDAPGYINDELDSDSNENVLSEFLKNF